jgi:hypothetical protein
MGAPLPRGLDAIEGLLNVVQDVLDILQAYGEPEQPVADAVLGDQRPFSVAGSYPR